MLNKKELEKQGYSFTKVGKIEYLDLSKPKEETLKCPIVEVEQQIRNHFIKKSKQKGKALSIVLPLVSQGQMTDLLSELYDLREEEKINKNLCKDIHKLLTSDPGEIISLINSKCRPIKKPQKKKAKKKKK